MLLQQLTFLASDCGHQREVKDESFFHIYSSLRTTERPEFQECSDYKERRDISLRKIKREGGVMFKKLKCKSLEYKGEGIINEGENLINTLVFPDLLTYERAFNALIMMVSATGCKEPGPIAVVSTGTQRYKRIPAIYFPDGWQLLAIAPYLDNSVDKIAILMQYLIQNGRVHQSIIHRLFFQTNCSDRVAFNSFFPYPDEFLYVDDLKTKPRIEIMQSPQLEYSNKEDMEVEEEDSCIKNIVDESKKEILIDDLPVCDYSPTFFKDAVQPTIVAAMPGGIFEASMGFVQTPVGYRSHPFYPKYEYCHPAFCLAACVSNSGMMVICREYYDHVTRSAPKSGGKLKRLFCIRTLDRRKIDVCTQYSHVVAQLLVQDCEPLHYTCRTFYKYYASYWKKKKKISIENICSNHDYIHLPTLIGGWIMSKIRSVLLGDTAIGDNIYCYLGLPCQFPYEDYEDAIVLFLSNVMRQGSMMMVRKEIFSNLVYSCPKYSHVFNYLIYEDTGQDLLFFFRKSFDVFCSDDSGISSHPVKSITTYSL
jgi:hypothetical protein